MQLDKLVHQLLCEWAVLEPDESPLRSEVVYRRGRPCGLLYVVEGPRQIRPSAIWAAEEQRLIVYDSQARRLQELRLQPGPPLAALLSRAEQVSALRPAA